MPLKDIKKQILAAGPWGFPLFILFLIALYFPVFLHLDYLPIQLFDESRRVVNALEMAANGNILVTYYDGKPDMWGKPPLPIWFMALSMKLFGFNELAARLPSAILGFSLLFFIFYFCRNYLKNPMLGAFAALILVSSKGFIREHVVRTADYDIYLCVWTCLYPLFFFLYTETKLPKKQQKYLYLTAFFITLAVLTKGIAGLFFAPGLLLFAIIRGKLGSILSSKHTYIALLGFLCLIGGYYFLRDFYTPSYLRRVMHNEVSGRYFLGFQGHDHGPLFYLNNLLQARFTPWVYLVPIGLIIGVWKPGQLRHLTILLFINASILLGVISFSQTQLSWYDAPAIPLLAIISAIPLSALLQKIIGNFEKRINLKQALLILLSTVLIFIIPYSKIIQSVYFPERNWANNEKDLYGYFMRSNPWANEYLVCNIGYNAASKFYIEALRKEGYTLGTFHPKSRQPQGATVLICERNAKKMIRETHFVYRYMEWKQCELLKITGINEELFCDETGKLRWRVY